MRRRMDKTEQEVVFQYFKKHEMLDRSDYRRRYWIANDASELEMWSPRDYTLELKHIKGLVKHIEGIEE